VRDFGISRGEVLHKNDADSVVAWVERTRMSEVESNLVSITNAVTRAWSWTSVIIKALKARIKK